MRRPGLGRTHAARVPGASATEAVRRALVYPEVHFVPSDQPSNQTLQLDGCLRSSPAARPSRVALEAIGRFGSSSGARLIGQIAGAHLTLSSSVDSLECKWTVPNVEAGDDEEECFGAISRVSDGGVR